MAQMGEALPPGTRIDRFEIESLIGEGGFGAVYRARHSVLGHTVALKLLRPEHTEDEELLARFFREAQASASIGSKHIVQVLDCGTSPEGWNFLAMELLEGQSLEEFMEAASPVAPFGLERAVDVALQTLDSLTAAHRAGIIHRDLKPANIFLTRDPDTGGELVKLLDFGVSKFVVLEDTETGLTQTGAMLGTPLYMAPEQFHNARDVDLRVDIYSAAAVLYQMLSGRVPIEADTYADLVVRVCCEQAVPLRHVAPQIPPEIEAAVMKGLVMEPESRWPTADAFAFGLRAAYQGTKGNTVPGQANMGPHDQDATLTDPADSTRPGVGGLPGPSGGTLPAAAAPPADGAAGPNHPPSQLVSAAAEPPRAANQQLPVPPTQPPGTPAVVPQIAATQPVTVKSAFGGAAPPGEPNAGMRDFPEPSSQHGLATGGFLPPADPYQSGEQSLGVGSFPEPVDGAAPPAATTQTDDGPPAEPTAEPPRRRRKWPFVVVPLLFLLLAGTAVGGWFAYDHFWGGSDAAVTAATPGTPATPTTPPPATPGIPATPGTPATPGAPANPGTPTTPGSGTENNPLGQIVTTVLGTVGEGLAGPSASPMDGNTSTGVQLYQPQAMGQVDQAAVRQVMLAAQAGMATCRQPGQSVRVRLHGAVSGNQLTSFGPAVTNTAPANISQCCADAFRRAIPQGWQPGQAGTFFFDVLLSSQ